LGEKKGESFQWGAEEAYAECTFYNKDKGRGSCRVIVIEISKLEGSTATGGEKWRPSCTWERGGKGGPSVKEHRTKRVVARRAETPAASGTKVRAKVGKFEGF